MAENLSAGQERKPWSVLAYIVADDKGASSPLDEAARQEIRTICDAADRSRVPVAVQVDFKNTPGVFRAALRESRGFEDADPDNYDLWRIVARKAENSDLRLQKERRDLNAASGGVLKAFLEWGRQQCPAERYLIFFDGHAFGPMGMFYDSAPGDRAPTTLRLNQLADALQSAEGPADIILFRDCFMDNLETAFQLQGVARYMVATQAEEPIAGQWPWITLLTSLLPDADSSGIARSVAAQVGNYHDVQFELATLKSDNRALAAQLGDQPKNLNFVPFADVPYALIDITAASQVTNPLRALVQSLSEARMDPSRRLTCSRALEAARRGNVADHANPGDPALLDLPAMCDNLQALSTDPVASSAATLGDVVRNNLIQWVYTHKHTYSGLSIHYRPATAAGISASFIEAASPDDLKADAEYYRNLALCRATGWDRISLAPLAEVDHVR
jgi:hypothetical protein